jgi:hypothetical protein
MREIKDVAGVGRDADKVYRITEMPAVKAEKWALKALWAVASAGVDIPEDVSNAPLAKLAEFGLKALAKVPFHIAEPLLDEMLTCVEVLTDAGVRKLIADDFQDVKTILKLRKEVLSLHVDFFTQD